MLTALAMNNESTVEELIIEIEKKRAELVALGMKKGFQDPEVISVSQQLDLLINQYQSIIRYDYDSWQ